MKDGRYWKIRLCNIFLTSYKMGGFTLVGPNFTFQNLPNKVRCRCLGFTSNISQDVEDMLLKDEEKILKVSNLPDSLVAQMENFHLGDERHYDVKKRVGIDESMYKSNVTNSVSTLATANLTPAPSASPSWYRRDDV